MNEPEKDWEKIHDEYLKRTSLLTEKWEKENHKQGIPSNRFWARARRKLLSVIRFYFCFLRLSWWRAKWEVLKLRWLVWTQRCDFCGRRLWLKRARTISIALPGKLHVYGRDWWLCHLCFEFAKVRWLNVLQEKEVSEKVS